MTDILDCTLRDGSYVNRFQFSLAATRATCRALDEAGVRFIEVGHGVGLGAYRRGGDFAAAHSDEEYVATAAQSVKQAKFGVFCIPGYAMLEDVDLCHEHGMHFIRIGTNVTEVEKSRPFIERAKKHGMLVCANFMKSYVVPPEEFAEKARMSAQYGADVVYIVDSTGGMTGDDVKAYYEAVREKTGIGLGFHGHNNLGLANANSLLAADLGAALVDSSLQGLGRSSGNAITEMLVFLFQKRGKDLGIDPFKLLDAGFGLAKPLIHERGQNPIDTVCGYADFHSSYLPVIKRISGKYAVDPRELIIEVCKMNRVDAPEDLVESVAKNLPRYEEMVFELRYNLDRYYTNEQGRA